MPTKKRAVKPAQKNDDSVVYKVMAALLCACIETLAVQQVCKYYVTINHMDTVRAGLFPAIFVCAGLTLIAAVALIVKFRSKLRFALVLTTLNLAACTVACALLYALWTGPAVLLYFAFFGLAVLISVYLLYQPEFFLLTAGTMAAAFGFYCLSRLGGGVSALRLVLILLLAVVFVLVGLIALRAAKNKGIFQLGSFRWRAILLDSPLPLYITSLLWLLCLLAGLLLGAFFYYCCIFAAIAYEFIFAFYFTVKMK